MRCPADGSDLTAAFIEGDLLAAHASEDGRVDKYVSAAADDATAVIAGEAQNVIGVAITPALDATPGSDDLWIRFLAQLWRF